MAIFLEGHLVAAPCGRTAPLQIGTVVNVRGRVSTLDGGYIGNAMVECPMQHVARDAPPPSAAEPVGSRAWLARHAQAVHAALRGFVAEGDTAGDQLDWYDLRRDAGDCVEAASRLFGVMLDPDLLMMNTWASDPWLDVAFGGLRPTHFASTNSIPVGWLQMLPRDPQSHTVLLHWRDRKTLPVFLRFLEDQTLPLTLVM